MAGENVEVVRRVVDDWNAGRRTVDDAVFHPKVEFLPLRAATEGGYYGLAGVEAFVADTLEVFDGFELRYELEDLGAQILAWGQIHVRARGSGIETDIESGGLFTFAGGRIVRWEDFGSRDRALAATRGCQRSTK